MTTKGFLAKYPRLTGIILIFVYINDWRRYVKFSGATGLRSKAKMVGKIVAQYHVVEKGLTMPETRLGFGKDNLFSLIDNCTEFLKKYGSEEEQVVQAVSVIKEYKQFHDDHNFKLAPEVAEKINNFEKLWAGILAGSQKHATGEDYFSQSNAPFPQFSDSRFSIRNYSPVDVPMTVIRNAVELARNAPSACNRQTVRVHVYSDKEKIGKMLYVQGGSRGFGHLANKLIVITAELGAFHGVFERNQAFVDGGMWAMNLLYALHYNKVAACSLNCSNSFEKDKQLRELTNIPESESFIMMISCGYVPEKFKAASSKRYSVDFMSTFE